MWELLTRDFHWDVPSDHPVKVYDPSRQPGSATRLQIFEIAITAVLAYVSPEFTWHVTPNRPDGGLDFIGEQRFLEDRELGIAAAITVGGQCKKRTRVDDVVAEVAGSLLRMADAFNPTFFVVALSARLTRDRVEAARALLERQCRRHCHILDRRQIEGLMADHVEAAIDILRQGLTPAEVDDVLAYLADRRRGTRDPSVTVSADPRVLAGVPFRVDVTVRSTLVSNPAARLWWRPSDVTGADDETLTLVGPVDADVGGVVLSSGGPSEDPLAARHVLEMVTYSVGQVDLGEVVIGLAAERVAIETARLGSIEVVDNVRPRFFERPFRGGMSRLSQAYERALAAGVASLAVVGPGGSGKSRMCEEFALEKRRTGSTVVSAKQSKTTDDPHTVVCDLLFGLAQGDVPAGHPAESVIRGVAAYDRALAEKAAPAIRSLFGVGDERAAFTADQAILSVLVLLVVARTRRAPLIVHLQDLHWCSADVLLLLERLVWQLTYTVGPGRRPETRSTSGVLFVFEGRVRERLSRGDDVWTSEPFEAFVQRADCPIVRCSSFSAEDGLAFVRRLFEDRHSARRLVPVELLPLQDDLVRHIDRTAGGNPFHSLEQVQLLKDQGVISQNPHTGSLYMIQAEPAGAVLPESVFACVQVRWQYLRQHTPALALLLWGCALLEDRLAASLFRCLWQGLAPDVSLRDVDGTDILWTGDGEEQAVVFRHENYFEALRRFTVPRPERQRVIEAYEAWFRQLSRPSPADRFRWARVLLEKPEPDRARARALLASALRSARRQGDTRLGQVVAAAYLDLVWQDDTPSTLDLPTFFRRCDDEVALARELLTSDQSRAARRLENLRRRVIERVETAAPRSPALLAELHRRHLTVEVVYAQRLFNGRQPFRAAEIASRVVRDIAVLAPAADARLTGEWRELEMEALHTHAVALALLGDDSGAVAVSERAVELARGSATQVAREVISTHGNLLSRIDPTAGEALLRECLADEPVPQAPTEINLGIALILLASRCDASEDDRRDALLDEARRRLTKVFTTTFRLGLYPDAGAAALVRAIVSAMTGDGDEVSWFAQGVAASARGRQMETLWRSHVNLAIALHQADGRVDQAVRDHARAGLTIIEDTLAVYPQPDRSPRFRLVKIPMAHAVRLLILAGDDVATRTLERYPALRTCFEDSATGALLPDRGGDAYHGWLVTVGDVDYVLY